MVEYKRRLGSDDRDEIPMNKEICVQAAMVRAMRADAGLLQPVGGWEGHGRALPVSRGILRDRVRSPGSRLTSASGSGCCWRARLVFRTSARLGIQSEMARRQF